METTSFSSPCYFKKTDFRSDWLRNFLKRQKVQSRGNFLRNHFERPTDVDHSAGVIDLIRDGPREIGNMRKLGYRNTTHLKKIYRNIECDLVLIFINLSQSYQLMIFYTYIYMNTKLLQCYNYIKSDFFLSIQFSIFTLLAFFKKKSFN